MTTTKSDLVNAVAEANGFPQNKSAEIVEILIDLIKTKLAGGENVLISGFGKFCVKEKREARAESGDRRGDDAGGQAGGDFQVLRSAKG